MRAHAVSLEKGFLRSCRFPFPVLTCNRFSCNSLPLPLSSLQRFDLCLNLFLLDSPTSFLSLFIAPIFRTQFPYLCTPPDFPYNLLTAKHRRRFQRVVWTLGLLQPGFGRKRRGGVVGGSGRPPRVGGGMKSKEKLVGPWGGQGPCWGVWVGLPP